MARTSADGKPSAAPELLLWVRRNPLGLAIVGHAAVSLWTARLAVKVAELRVKNAREVGWLASQVDRELRLNPSRDADPAERLEAPRGLCLVPGRRPGRGATKRVRVFLTTSVEGENLFGIAVGNRFINVFILEPEGVLRVDSKSESTSVGMDIMARD